MTKITKISAIVAVLCVVSLVAPVYPGGQFNQENGSGILIGEHWELSTSLSDRTPGDGRTVIIYFAQGTAAARISAIQASHMSWENVVAIDFDDVGNTLPHAPSNGAGGGTPDGFNTHSFEFTLGCGGGLGVTPTVINATTGQIVEADVFYEGNNCVNWSTDGSPTAMQFELEAVAVHEMGHFVGLSHSGEVDSTMFPSIAPGTTASASLEPDDDVSVTRVYSQDGGDVLVPSGGISGRIIDGSNSNDGKVCALVYAFSADESPITSFNQAYVQVYSGSVIGASATSNTSGASSGFYEINGLPDGDWFVLLDPIGNVVTAPQITNWCAANSEAGFAQEWWNGVAESGAEGCTTCVVPVTVSGGQITTGIDILTETGTCVISEDPETSCADGIDNDCDGFGDCDDGDCASDPACSGGCTGDPQCDDSNVCNGAETCNGGVCQPGTPLTCDDGVFCNGAETCNTVSGCQAGTPPSCNDGVGCTDDSCNAGTDSCDNIANNANCPDDGQFCNGTESCDSVSDCVSSGDPCPGGTTCNEGTDTCDVSACNDDGTCDAGEDCDNCSADCISGTTSGASCGNGICEAGDGEDCLSCATDCNGKQNGNPNGRFCCGNGGQNPVGCDAGLCGPDCTTTPVGGGAAYCCGDGPCEGDEDSFNCAVDCGAPSFCGDGTCDAGEDTCNCSADCGAAPGSETSCTDGVDNDCDGAIDCNDSDCAGDPSCNCGGNKASCTVNSDCCSGNCRNGSCKGN